MYFSSILAATALSFLIVSASVIPVPPSRRAEDDAPVMNIDFADPSILEDDEGNWYAFGTTGNGKHIQVAKADCIYGNWSLLDDVDALPQYASWSTGSNTWAPDVHQLSDGSFVMYYSGEVADNPSHHCIGTATSDTITGPYIPEEEPFACNLTVGGAIDASGFEDDDGTRYVVYKVDGNSIGHGGSCGNTVQPIVPTPIMLQEVESDGVTKVGDAVQILDRTEDDGPYVEAPSLIRTEKGMYILFFSSGCYLEPSYNVNYATSMSVSGPYTRAKQPLLRTGEYGLQAPGGATAVHVRDKIGVVYHANCQEGRCMHTSPTDIDGRDVDVVI
ncbi:glycoside hydrolase family 43 protein [Hypoxylon trugodes]|uniref:glycoside hydrolase family 43 protein n=1 Tax=Hypoxylon trugodes TaxID=326681 RepID=UPI002192F5B0|nr:glycoside hydrolase family 43 protein [Hypoxylon trugodes]KAI1390829.1 glycoside hydrolase family 43 protein [Hypoxylon trugodes]